jgi:RES domain-containing protein
MGAVRVGGRWNPVGSPAVYASSSLSLANLEILVNYSVLPKDFVATEILIPEHLVETVPDEELPRGVPFSVFLRRF